jgi:DNA-binding GntR family transcriptional regulator
LWKLALSGCRFSAVGLLRAGYLEVSFRHGGKVCDIDFDRVDQLYDLRIVLESAAIELVAGERPPHPTIDAL